MYVEANGKAKFKVDKTGEVITVDATDLDWECEGTGEERGMGSELIHSAEYSIESKSGESFDVTWSVWEYPVGVENTSETSVPHGISLLEDLQYGLSAFNLRLGVFNNAFSHSRPNPALNLAPFSRWTLRDKAAQRRLALR